MSVLDIQQTNNTASVLSGTMSQYYAQIQAQTLTATSPSGSWDQLELILQTGSWYNQSTGQFVAYTNVGVTIRIYSGTTLGSGTLLGTSDSVTVANNTPQTCIFTFATPVAYTAGAGYYFTVTPNSFGSGSNVNPTLYVAAGSGYAGGTRWELING